MHSHADTTASANDIHDDDTPPNEGDVRCKNCTHWIPAARMALHEATCYRNNLLCPSGCGQVFQKRSPEFAAHWHCAQPHSEPVWGNTASSQAYHNHLYHPSKPLVCPSCPTTETFPTLPLLAHHRTTTCPGKLILCRFCHLLVPQEGDPDGPPSADVLLSGLTPHELADGARTTECPLCGKFVRLRDLATHQNFHEMDRLRRPTPVVCANALCGRTVRGGGSAATAENGNNNSNDLGLCSVCFGPLYVSMYDPDGKALRRRIERRYLQQLGTGCGKSWCGNAFCRTGRGNLNPGDPAAGRSVPAKEAVPLVKPVLDALKAQQEAKKEGEVQVNFCVDEPSQRRRMLARVLGEAGGDKAAGAFGGNGGYVEEWWVAALEAEGGDEEKARRWLGSWGVGRAEAK